MYIKIIALTLLFSIYLYAVPDETDLGKFQLLTLSPNNKTLVLIRCNTKTGEGWYRVGSKWHKGVEEKPLEISRYICATQAFGKDGWLFLRMDVNSGRLWTLQGEVWRLVLN